MNSLPSHWPPAPPATGKHRRDLIKIAKSCAQYYEVMAHNAYVDNIGRAHVLIPITGRGAYYADVLCDEIKQVRLEQLQQAVDIIDNPEDEQSGQPSGITTETGRIIATVARYTHTGAYCAANDVMPDK